MKLLFVFLLIIGVAGVVLYYCGGYSSFDPSQQGRDARAAIGPGMSWTKVIDAAGQPREYRVITERKQKIGGVERSLRKPGPCNTFKRDSLAGRISNGSLPHGFIFEYRFSNSVAFAVTFDGFGNVVGVDDLTTMADLLDMK